MVKSIREEREDLAKLVKRRNRLSKTIKDQEKKGGANIWLRIEHEYIEREGVNRDIFNTRRRIVRRKR